MEINFNYKLINNINKKRGCPYFDNLPINP